MFLIVTVFLLAQNNFFYYGKRILTVEDQKGLEHQRHLVLDTGRVGLTKHSTKKTHIKRKLVSGYKTVMELPTFIFVVSYCMSHWFACVVCVCMNCISVT